jgi:hypothetical protein
MIERLQQNVALLGKVSHWLVYNPKAKDGNSYYLSCEYQGDPLERFGLHACFFLCYLTQWNQRQLGISLG